MSRVKKDSNNINTEVEQEDISDTSLFKEIEDDFVNIDSEEDEESEETLLRGRAVDLGIKLTKDDTVDSIRTKVNNKLTPRNKDIDAPNKDKYGKGISSLRTKCMKLKRCRVTNLHPRKTGMKGQLFTFLNSKSGSIRRFVPFGDECGKHGVNLPEAIYNIVKNTKYVRFKSVKNPNGGDDLKERELVYHYHIQDLPDMTEKELRELRRQQAGRFDR